MNLYVNQEQWNEGLSIQWNVFVNRLVNP